MASPVYLVRYRELQCAVPISSRRFIPLWLSSYPSGGTARVKIVAYTLLVLGPVVIATSHPLTVYLNAPMLCLGAALSIVGLFMRSRIREGIPLHTVTDEDRTQLTQMRQEFKQMRRVFSLRNIFGRLFRAFGMFFLLVSVLGPFFSEGVLKGEGYDWRVSVVAFVLGLALVLCAKLLIGKSR